MINKLLSQIIKLKIHERFRLLQISNAFQCSKGFPVDVSLWNLLEFPFLAC